MNSLTTKLENFQNIVQKYSFEKHSALLSKESRMLFSYVAFSLSVLFLTSILVERKYTIDEFYFLPLYLFSSLAFTVTPLIFISKKYRKIINSWFDNEKQKINKESIFELLFALDELLPFLTNKSRVIRFKKEIVIAMTTPNYQTKTLDVMCDFSSSSGFLNIKKEIINNINTELITQEYKQFKNERKSENVMEMNSDLSKTNKLKTIL